LALSAVATSGSLRTAGLIGCGPINYEVLRFTVHLYALETVLVSDLDPARAEAFTQRARTELPSIALRAAAPEEIWERADVVSIATNATTPHISALPARRLIVLHISLRDLAPEVIAGCYNIVDVAEHAFSARTSLHLAAEQTGRRDFVHATIPALLAGTTRYEPPPSVPTVVSPFGLSILDLAVLREVLARSNLLASATRVRDFVGTVLT
jgi:ornithine cyclodeaminase/alanine dehydrogenase-like protein (mu-crystallin family)